MNYAVEDGVSCFAASMLVGTSGLNVTWFGGEPLLARCSMLRTSTKLRQESDRLALPFKSAMMTNGVLLDQITREDIETLGLKTVQVTFDGNSTFHDKTRYFPGGGGSFSAIVNSIDRLAALEPKMALSIRLNCTDENFSSFPELLREFPADLKKRCRVFVHMAPSAEGSGNKDMNITQNRSQAFMKEVELYFEALNQGWKISNPLANFAFNHCEYDKPNAFQIGPDGSVYICSQRHNDGASIGSVLALDTIEMPTNWFSKSPCSDSECLKYSSLPVCDNGDTLVRDEGVRERESEYSHMDLCVLLEVIQYLQGEHIQQFSCSA